jgi:hypothetical protein
METVLLKKSILTLDGKNYPVNLSEWGFFRLTGAELAEYSAVMNSFVEYTRLVIEQNIYTITSIFEEINGIPFEVGVRITRPVGHKFPIDDDVMYWVGRMRDDPCVTTFNWMEPVS